MIEYLKELLKKLFGGGSSPEKFDWRKVRGLMVTDWATMKNLKSVREKDAKKLRTKYNLLYVVGDVVRPYCGKGRTETAPTSLLIDNLKLMKSWGFNLAIVMGNEPSVRNGQSSSLGGTGGQNLNPSQLYTPARLENEKKCVKALLDKAGDIISMIVLYLEPSQASAVQFQKELAAYIQSTGWKGVILADGVNSGWVQPTGTLNFGPTNLTKWLENTEDNDILNADGLLQIDGNADTIKKMTAVKKPWVLWFKSYVGSYNTANPSPLQNWMVDSVSK